MRMKKKLSNNGIRLSLTLLVFANACASTDGKKSAKPSKDYHPGIVPANFTHVVTNPYFPLVPGTTHTFVEKEGRETRENKVIVTSDTKKIMGVKCVVVHDTVTQNGKLVEDTLDWYAQDKQGAVWYFGEASKEFKSGGRISTEGSWEGGVNGAQPGIQMPAVPKPGAPYRQEYSAGSAEDMGQVVAVGETVTVPAGTYKDCVKTRDWSMLESGSEHKWYAKGIGFVRSETTVGEVVVLTSVTNK